jgi:hypothetical protein
LCASCQNKQKNKPEVDAFRCKFPFAGIIGIAEHDKQYHGATTVQKKIGTFLTNQLQRGERRKTDFKDLKETQQVSITC